MNGAGGASGAKSFPRACVASPHYLASAAGLEVLASGGTAMDAAIATNLTLGVVAPYQCGYGGDLFAMVWRPGEGVSAYNGSGRAPAAATVDAVVAALGGSGDVPTQMPQVGPLAVTVPGAVEAWFVLLERFGTRSFGELAATARRHAEEGFVLSARAAASIERSKVRFEGADGWQAIYGATAAGRVLRQPALARTIATLADEGPDAFYRGRIGADIADHVASLGGLMAPGDLAAHRGEWVSPLSFGYRGLEILEMPPNTQGIAVLEALAIVQAAGALPPEGPQRQHLLIEAMKLALVDRDAFVTDPDRMSIDAEALCSAEWASDRASRIDPARAGEPVAGRVATGGTAYLCAADGGGTCVSLIQSNYTGFGSGVTVPAWGINLHNRGGYFSLDPLHTNATAPGKRTLHTLIPAMALRDGELWLVFGTMGGDGQAQTHLQLLARIVDDGEDIQRAIDAPRWVMSPRDWSIVVDGRADPSTVERLRSMGHRIEPTPWWDPVLGHAHAIRVTEDGYLGATDPRAEGAVLGR